MARPASSRSSAALLERWTRPLVVPPEGLERLRTRLLVLGFWLTLALLETAKEWASWRMRGSPRTLDSVALINVPFWLYWALATPVVVALARAAPLEGPRRARSIALHVAASIVAALLHSATIAFIAVATLGRAGELTDPSFEGQFRALAEGYLVLEIFVYWMIVGTYYALLYHRRLLEGRVREAEALARAARSEASAADARLRALRMELDPHFLFNALNAVSGLVRGGDRRRATEMLARLGELFRITLRYGRSGPVSLGRELELVGRYLDIEKIRLGDRLLVEVDAAPDTLEIRVPPLLLQPLVENAVRHGVAAQPGPVRLSVSSRRQDGGVCIQICDSGPGPAPGHVEGTGLGNVRARLAEQYGQGARFHLDAPAGGGCRATVWIPSGRAS